MREHVDSPGQLRLPTSEQGDKGMVQRAVLSRGEEQERACVGLLGAGSTNDVLVARQLAVIAHHAVEPPHDRRGPRRGQEQMLEEEHKRIARLQELQGDDESSVH